jgi:myo-inositol-1(or 4)-monophosphatase
MGLHGGFEPLFGAILHPPTGDLYFARPGQGAFVNGEALKLKTGASLASSSICTGFGYQTGKTLEAILASAHAIQESCLGMRINGAAALDLALTARGLFEGFYEYRLKPWDMAAGAVIAREAGLSVFAIDGKPYETFDHSSIIVAHPEIEEELRAILDRNFAHLKANRSEA